MSYTYTDTSMHRIDVETKAIENPDHQPLIVGEALSHYVPFEVSDYEIDGVDVTGMKIQVVWWNDKTKQEKAEDVINLNHNEEDTFFTFGWVIKGEAAAKPGNLYFYVKISDGKGYVWRTLDANKKVVTSKIWEAETGGDNVPEPGSTVDERLKALEEDRDNLPTKEDLLAIENAIEAVNNELFTETGDGADITAVPFSYDRYFDGKINSFVTKNTNYSTDYIDLNGVTKILYTGSMGGEVATWFDVNKNYISPQNVYSGGTTLDKVNVLLDRPNNATYVVLASRNSSHSNPPTKTPEVLVYKGYDYGTKVNKLTLIEGNIKKLENNILNVYSRDESDRKYAQKEALASLQNDFYTDVQSDIPFISGTYFDESFKTDVSNSSTDYIDIDELKGLLYTGSRPANVAAWFDANKTYIPPQNVYSGNNTLIDVDVLAYKPVDAKYVVLSSRNSNHSNPPKYGPRAVAIRNGNKVEALLNDVDKKIEPLLSKYENIYEEWEQGSIDGNTGENVESSSRIRTKNYIVFSSLKSFNETIQIPSGWTVVPRLYTLNGEYLVGGYGLKNQINVESLSKASAYMGDLTGNAEKTLQTNAFCVRFFAYKDSGADIVPSEFDIKIVSHIKQLSDCKKVRSIEDIGKIANGVLSCECKTYIVDETIDINISAIKVFDGNGAKFIASSDIPVFRINGTLKTSSSSPNGLAGYVMSQAGTIFKNVTITSSSGNTGTGIIVEKCFGLNIDHCYIYRMAVGIEIKGINRNCLFTNNQLYANALYGFWFRSTTNFHQANFNGNMVTYNKYSVFYDGCDQIANHQWSGNDLEIGNYPPNGSDFIVFYINANADEPHSLLLSEIEICGNTIQGHGENYNVIKIIGSPYRYVTDISIVGNHISNSLGDAVHLEKCMNVSACGNTFKDVRQSIYKLDGECENICISGEVARTNNGKIAAPNTAILKKVICKNVISAGPNYISNATMTNCDIE